MCHTLATEGMTLLHVLMVEKWAAGFKRAIGGFKYDPTGFFIMNVTFKQVIKRAK